jgi:phospho-N-acetylmuramoyl-pentapeptide-transferase
MLLHFLESTFFKLITFRAALAGIGAFVASIALGPRIIRWLRERKIGEKTEKEDSRKLDEIMRSKKNTPTMGGVFIVAAIVLTLALLGNFANPTLYVLLVVVLAMGALGAVDDWMKLTGLRKGGMRMGLKFVLQCLIGYGAGVFLWWSLIQSDPETATKLFIPFDGYVDLGAFYPFWVMLVIVATSNAVNITDGLDGLAGGCLAISSFAYAVIAYIVGRVDFTEYLGIQYVRASAELTVAATAMLGASLGFLWFNSGQTGDAALPRRRRLRHRGGLVAAPDPLLQAHRAAALPDRAAPPPFPVPGAARDQDHAALLDRRGGPCGHEPLAAETPVARPGRVPAWGILRTACRMRRAPGSTTFANGSAPAPWARCGRPGIRSSSAGPP